MSTTAPLQNIAAKAPLIGKSSHAGLLLQRRCACGSPAASSLTGKCEACEKNRLQAKLTIGASNDPLEQEADRVADQVLAAPAHAIVSGAKPSIQRLTGQATGNLGTAPPSVDRVLSGSGKPLDSALQQDMGQRFGHDFSRVRVHTDSIAEQSAREVNAHAYTVGQNIVFGTGRFAPETNEGRHLLAHELTHVLQQRGDLGLIQRKVDIGDFEGGDFSLPVLKAYLTKIQTSRQIEDNSDSDDKAREIVKRLRQGKIELDPKNRILLIILLIKEMQSGFTGDDDERAILSLLLNSNDRDLEAIFRVINPKDLDEDFQTDEEDVLREFYDRKFEGGRKAALKGSRTLQSQKTPLKKDNPPNAGSARNNNPPGFAEAKTNHNAQQKKVLELFTSAKAVTRGNSAADTALQNSIEWIEPTKVDNNEVAPKFQLLILTPTHDSRSRKQDDQGSEAHLEAYFDSRIKHPEIGGDYDPTGGSDAGIDYKKSGTLGTARHPPEGARSAMQFFAVRMYIDETTPVTMENLSKTLIHETQHMAARIPATSIPPNVAGIERRYQTEFNAYWVEARVSEKDCFPGGQCTDKNRQENVGLKPLFPSKEGFGSETTKAGSSTVKGSGIKKKAACKTLLPNCSFESKEQPTNFKNEKQQQIFEHLVTTYDDDLFDCSYVCNDKFKDMVDKLVGPVGVNLVNSIRIEALLNKVDGCNPKMAVDDPQIKIVIEAAALLDDLDKAFLRSSLAAFPKEAKEETLRQTEEKKEKEKQELKQAFGRTDSGSQTERHDAPVSFWIYLMRKLPEAGIKKVQDTIKSKAASEKKP